MYTIRKEFKFEAAHVLNASESKECQYVHGHSYRVEVFLSRMDLNANGMVEDFKVVKEAFKPVIDKMDHALIIEFSPPSILKNDKILVLGVNPTAENMAEFIYKQAHTDILSDEISIDAIRVHETDSGYAEFTPSSPSLIDENNPPIGRSGVPNKTLIDEICQIVKHVDTSVGMFSSKENRTHIYSEGYERIKNLITTYLNTDIKGGD